MGNYIQLLLSPITHLQALLKWVIIFNSCYLKLNVNRTRLLTSEVKEFDRDVNAWVAGAQWLSGRVLDLRPRGHGLEPHRRHCVVVLE